ncbi:hypothetical protein P171DRAFT_438510 [Karstenula rhodostoma CBS 690.94]|uniref:Uncharacterized protein n=1 Tax=Karstenula rhodostoma CBS 690.94 TaxID=1392251 RepID=A0A9P4PYW1_9PLEO|nr:hypothetical protein P171DRAFT_438510 [Karstenula rhodostoma CBS 690.94]
MAYYANIRPIPTGRTGTLIVYRPGFNPISARVEITSRHVEVHTFTSQGLHTGICARTIIRCMDDGGPIPILVDFDTTTRTYLGTYICTERDINLWRPGSQNVGLMRHSVPMHQHPAYFGTRNAVFEAERRAANVPAVLPQQRPAAPMEGASADFPIFLEDNDYGAQNSIPAPTEPTLQPFGPPPQPFHAPQGPPPQRFLALQGPPPQPFHAPQGPTPQPIPTPREPTPQPTPAPKEPLPPSHLKERLAHMKNFVGHTGNTAQSDWLISMKLGNYKQKEEYCRLFWPSNKAAEVDLDWVVRHFKDFTEARIERLAIEARKKEEGLDWEEERREIEAGWAKNREEWSVNAKREKELGAAKRKAEERARRQAAAAENQQRDAEEKRKKDAEEKEKRAAAKRAAAEEKNKKAEEERGEKERQRRKAAEEKKRAKEEEKARKAEEKKEQRAAAPSRKRKAAPAPAEPAKKRKTEAQLPTPGAAEDREILDALLAEFNTEEKVGDDAATAAFQSAPAEAAEEESEDESDADDDEPAAIIKARQEEAASMPQEQHTPAPTSPAQTSEPKEEVEREANDDGLFSEAEEANDDGLFSEAEEASGDEDEDGSEVEEEPVPGVISPREIELTRINKEIEELEGQLKMTLGNKLFQSRVQGRIEKLKVQRENL